MLTEDDITSIINEAGWEIDHITPIEDVYMVLLSTPENTALQIPDDMPLLELQKKIYQAQLRTLRKLLHRQNAAIESYRNQITSSTKTTLH